MAILTAILAILAWAFIALAAIVHRLQWFALRDGPGPALVGLLLTMSPALLALAAIALFAD